MVRDVDLSRALLTNELAQLTRDRPAEWITTARAAALLRCSAATVRRKAARGDIIAVKDGGRWLVWRRDAKRLSVRLP
jgi:excisionase family DNA binding protein